MAYGEPDVYYSPEKFGLKIIAEHEWEIPCCNFDKTIAWQKVDAPEFFYASDSGGYYQSPFESFTSIESLTPIVDYKEFADAIMTNYEERISWGKYAEEETITPHDFLRKVYRAMKGRSIHHVSNHGREVLMSAKDDRAVIIVKVEERYSVAVIDIVYNSDHDYEKFTSISSALRRARELKKEYGVSRNRFVPLLQDIREEKP